MHRRTAAFVVTALTGALLAGCSPSPGSLPRACAIFDRSLARWQASVGDSSLTTPKAAGANTRFLGALDQATAEAGGTNLASALQAVAAGVRQTKPRVITLGVAAVRKTCPRV